MSSNYLLKEVTMTRIAKYLNDKFKSKRSNKPFVPVDVQGYIKRGSLPLYLGGNKIVLSKKDTGAKLYNVLK